MVEFGEVLTAMVTPFKKDFSLDLAQAAELANHLVDNGSDGIVVCGTTGEAPTLSGSEKLELFKTVREAVPKEKKVIANTGNYCTEESIVLTKQAEKTGVDGCMLVVPYYSKPPQDGLERHFRAIAEATSLPVIVYNVPSRTAKNLEAETLIKLAKVENIVGVKEASCDLEQVGKIIKNVSEDFLVLSGEDAVTFPIIALGGHGVISVASHVVGKELKEMITSAKEQNIDRAREIHLRLLPLFKTLFLTTNPIMVKKAVELMGIEVGPPRLPLVEATDQETTKLKSLLEEMNLI